MRQLLRILYAPCFCFGLIGLATWLIGYRQFGLWLLPALLLGAIALAFTAEAWLPYQREWNLPRRDRWRDALHAVVDKASTAELTI